MKLVVRYPSDDVPVEYFNARYEVLRKPLGSPKGSEQLSKDNDAIHAWIEADNEIAAVGRVHLLGLNEDGSAVDIQANSTCPAFSPLSNSRDSFFERNDLEKPSELRPAVQVRAMGTIDKFRGYGYAGCVLSECEIQSVKIWHAKTGWLQARVSAIPFYEKHGWICFGPEYNVPNVGMHRSMWKKFEKLNS